MPTDSAANSSLAEATDSAPSGTPSEVTASPVAAETQAPAPPGEKTASPPDAPVDDRAALLAAVQKAVQVKPENPSGEGNPTAPEGHSSKTDPKTAQTAADALEADPTDAELAGFVPRTKARFEKLLTQRNALRTENESLKPSVAKWTQMNEYLTRNDLAAEDVNLLLGVGAALRRGDFKAFRDGVMPYVELANQALGVTLPADLVAKVEAGEITEAAAKELSVTRLANQRLQGQAKARTQADTVANEATTQARVANAVQAAVTTWETETKGRDPDYALKAPAVLRISQALIAEQGRPKTAEAAVAMAKAAYEEAGRMFAAVRPAPRPTASVPSGARAVNGARAEPTTMMEAAIRGLERSRGA